MGFPANTAEHNGSLEIFTCQYSDCHKVFRRRSDLRRHVKSVHLRSKPFLCPAVGCFKRQQPTAFPRKDKLYDHLASMHDHRTLFVCPSDSCDKSPRRADEVYAHLVLAHVWLEFEYIMDLLKRLCHPSKRMIPCPAPSCKSKHLLDELLDHLLEHDYEDLKSTLEFSEASSLVAVKEDCLHSQRKNQPSACRCPFTSIRLRCPVCSSVVGRQEFEQHMKEEHYAHPNELEHFKIWKLHCEMNGIDTNRAEDWGRENSECMRGVSCPVCSWQGSYRPSRHHLDLRGNLSHIKEHRMEIYRLYAGFLADYRWGLVWEDLARPFGPPVNDAAGPPTTQPAG